MLPAASASATETAAGDELSITVRAGDDKVGTGFLGTFKDSVIRLIVENLIFTFDLTSVALLPS